MMKHMFKSKIHRVKVTDADLQYEGSVTIDSVLMKEANIVEYEKVAIWNVTNGNRVETYVIEGEANSGTICLNGAAARRFEVDDLIIIATFGLYTEEDLKTYEPTVVFVDENNKMVEKRKEVLPDKRVLPTK